MKIIKNRTGTAKTINGMIVELGKDRKFDDDGNEIFYDNENFFIHGYIMNESQKETYPDGVPAIWFQSGKLVGGGKSGHNPLNLVLEEIKSRCDVL